MLSHVLFQLEWWHTFATKHDMSRQSSTSCAIPRSCSLRFKATCSHFHHHQKKNIRDGEGALGKGKGKGKHIGRREFSSANIGDSENGIVRE